jgi:hypothetical protein
VYAGPEDVFCAISATTLNVRRGDITPAAAAAVPAVPAGFHGR